MKIISYHHSLSDCDSNDNCTTNLRRCRYDAAINALLFTAFWAVIVTGFAIKNRLRRWAKPISSHKLWPVIAQQVRDSAVNSNINALSAEIIASLFYNLLMEFPLLILEFIIISVA